MSKQRQRFSSQQKVMILKEHYLENKSISDICDHYNIHPTMFYQWQKKFFENAHLAFESDNGHETKKLTKKITQLEHKLSQKNEVLSELMEEHLTLKKNLGER